MIAQTLTATATIRKLCFDIQNQVNTVLAIAQTRTTSVESQTATQNRGEGQTKKQFERLLEQLKSNIVKSVASRLPAIIELEERLRQKLEDSEEEREEWREKYKKIFGLYESNQLQNDQLKIQIITLSDNYESIAKNHEELKYKYQELKQQFDSKLQEHKNQIYLDKINELNRGISSRSNSLDTDREKDKQVEKQKQSIRGQIEVLTCERQLFLEEIKQSQKEIGEFKAKMEELIQQKDRLTDENKELQHLLKGQQERSGKLDRQIMQLIDSNQQLKVQKLELQEEKRQLSGQIQRLKEEIKKSEDMVGEKNQEKEALNRQIVELKGDVVQVKGQNSLIRHKNNQLEDQLRQLKTKTQQSSKQNIQLRAQIQKLLQKLTQTTQTLEKKRIDQLRRLTDQLTNEKTKNIQHSNESNKKSHDKVQQISKMHRQITGKLQQKILLLEKSGKEKKEKISQLKFQIERLYESLQIQVEKQYKSTEKIKELTEKSQGLAKKNKQLQEKVTGLQQKQQNRQQKHSALSASIKAKDKKLKRMADLHAKLLKIVLPNLKQQLHNTRLACQHFCKMIQLQKQQTTFLITAKQQNFTRLLTQSLLQRQISTEQSTMSYQNQLLKWKQACKGYEQKYSSLKQANAEMTEELQKFRVKLSESQDLKGRKIEELEDKLDRQKLEQLGTMKTVEKLKEKCRQVQQYYRLVEQLQKQNYRLKESLNQMQTYSFQQRSFNHTKPRQKFTLYTHNDPQPNQHSRTTLSNYLSKPVAPSAANLNDLTAKAEHQRIRLQAVKREYTMMQGQQQY